MNLQYQTDHGRRYIKMAYLYGAFVLGAVPVAITRAPDADPTVHALGWVLLVASQALALAIRRRFLRNTGLWVADGQPMRANFRRPIESPDGLDGLEVERTSWGHKELRIRGSNWSTVGLRRSVGPLAEIIDGDNANRLLVREWTDDKAGPWVPTGVTWGERDDESFPAALAATIRQHLSPSASHTLGQ